MSAGALGAFSSALSDIAGLWSTAMTNSTNQKMNDQNIAMQDRWNVEAMKRYDEEFGYNKALQQQLFEREDTAIQRQVADMAKAGINPLSQTLTGSNAGQAVGLPNPVNGQAPQNTFAMQGYTNFHNLVAGALEAENAMQQIDTAGVARDKLNSERNYQELLNEEQKIDNLIKANKNGISVDDNGNLHINKNFRQEQDITESNYKNNEASRRRNEREDTFQENFGAHDLMSQAGRTATDVAGITYRAGQSVGDALDGVGEKTKDSANILSSIIKSAIEKEVQKVKDSFNNTKNKIKKSKAFNTGKWIYENMIKIN